MSDNNDEYKSFLIQSKPVEETVSDFLARLNINMSAYDYLSWLNDYNLIQIKQQYDGWDLIDNNIYLSIKSGDLIIKPSTPLVIPKSNIMIEDLSLYSEGQVTYQKDSSLFLGTHYDLLKDSSYIRTNITDIFNKNIGVKLINESVTVWWYSSILDTIFNITYFVTNVSLSKSNLSGNLSFNITPSRIDLLNSNVLSNDSVINLFANDINGDNDNRYYADNFELFMQYNDVIFVKFEELEIDKKGISDKQKGFVVPQSSLRKDPSICWDSICLIDKVRTSFQPSSGSKNISVVCRDLTKLFEEDGSYFLPYQFIQGKDDAHKFVFGGNENSSWFRRNMVSGDFNFFFNYELKKIDDSFKFIINHLSNLGLVPNSLFDSYKDKRAKVYEVSGQDSDVVKTLEVNGIWGIIQLNFDKMVLERRVTGENLINPSGNLMSLLSSLCFQPFVEIIMDVYKDEFEITVRQPPFNKSSLQSVITDEAFITVSKDDLLDYSLENETEFYSFYQIEPTGQIIGNEDSLFQSIIPIINLPLFMEKFGNKGYKVSDPYLSRISVEGNNGKEKDNMLKSLIGGLLNDLMYIIDSTVYLPFTRKGAITLNGDRRIKVGSFILNEATNELFYVDSVSNDISINTTSIDRTTTINVSRGMVIDYVNVNKRGLLPSPLEQNNNSVVSFQLQESVYSYFDIVDTDKLKEAIYNNITGEGIAVDFDIIVNKDAFNFFLNRMQLNRRFK